jgi:hypothetical protein
MSAIANAGWKTDCDSASAERMGFATEGISMSERLEFMRDTMIVLALQVVFRTAMVLRSWNY